MIDFNSHLLMCSGNGTDAFKTRYALLKKLIDFGFTKVVLAPRYLQNDNNYFPISERKKIVSDLELSAKYDGLQVKLFLTNEVFIMKNIDSVIRNGEVAPISRKYILIKLPVRGDISLRKVEDVLIGLRQKGYIPILAGPEKSEFLQKDFVQVDKLSGVGAMFQCGFGSIVGANGDGAERIMEYMLGRGFVDFLGTEAENVDDIAIVKFQKAKKKIVKLVGESGFGRIMRNAEGVLLN